MKLLESWQAHQYTVYALAGNSKSLFSSSSSGEVKEWDPKFCKQRVATLMLVRRPVDPSSCSKVTSFIWFIYIFKDKNKYVLFLTVYGDFFSSTFEVDFSSFVWFHFRIQRTIKRGKWKLCFSSMICSSQETTKELWERIYFASTLNSFKIWIIWILNLT